MKHKKQYHISYYNPITNTITQKKKNKIQYKITNY